MWPLLPDGSMDAQLWSEKLAVVVREARTCVAHGNSA